MLAFGTLRYVSAILRARRKLVKSINSAPKARDKARLAAPLLVFRVRGGGKGGGFEGGGGPKAGGARRSTILRFPPSSIFFQSNCQVVPQVDFGQKWCHGYIGRSNKDQFRGLNAGLLAVWQL